MTHLHEVRDIDRHYVIDPITRAISAASDAKKKLMKGDHNSEVLTFEIPKDIGHDMSSCNRVEIHFSNIASDRTNRSEDVYTVKNMLVQDDTLVFDWRISGNATKYVGLLSFRIRFGCVDENGVYTYKWHTDVFSDITISDGFDNTEAVFEAYADAISQWEARLDALERKVTIGVVELLADKWAGSENLYSQIVTIDGVTENSQVDLTPSVEQLVIFYEKDLTFVTENEGGVVTVYAIGQKPEHDYTIQVTITEVSV